MKKTNWLPQDRIHWFSAPQIGHDLTFFASILFILTFATGSLKAYAQPIVTSPLSPGFYELSDQKVPPAIRAAANSTFEIVIFNPIKWMTVNFSEMAVRGTRAEDRVSANETMDTQTKDVVLEQIKYCRKMGFNECDIYMPIGTGSGFLLGEGNTIWTDYHVIEGFVDSLAKIFNYPKSIAFMTLPFQNLPIAIFNFKKELVFMTKSKETFAKITGMPFDGNFIKYLEGNYDASSDFIKIKLSKTIGKPLKVANSKLADGEPVYAIGYPTGTGEFRTIADRDKDLALLPRSPYPDSRGDRLYVSFGYALNLYDGYVRTSQSNDPSQKLPLNKEEFYRAISFNRFLPSDDLPNFERIVFSQIDVVFGNSGGPLLNAQGDVVGMIGRIHVEEQNGKYFRSTTLSVDVRETVLSDPAPTGIVREVPGE